MKLFFVFVPKPVSLIIPLYFLFLICGLNAYTSSIPFRPIDSSKCNEEFPTVSFVLWHGMGDQCCSREMNQLINLLETSVPCSFVHSIQLGTDGSEDRRRSFFGDIHEQLNTVCSLLTRIPQLKNGFNAIGFSQGGLFLRALLQTCTDLKMNTLITFGAPHQGITDLPPSFCNDHSVECSMLKRLIKTAVYSTSVQHSLVQATYYKDLTQLDQYEKKNILLPYLNNEIRMNNTYSHRLSQLRKFVLVRHEKDEMMMPASSAWMYNFNESLSLDFTSTQMYSNNPLGLRELYMQQRLLFYKLPGNHLEFNKTQFLDIVLPNIESNPGTVFSSGLILQS